MKRGRKAEGRIAGGLAFLGLALTVPAGPSPAGEHAENVPALLEARGVIRCQPVLPYFCRNIHIGCSGQSKVETRAFELHVSGNRGRLVFEGDAGSEGPDSGPVRFGKGFALLRLRPDADYVKVEADGRYSFRIYRRDTALMSYGTCS